MYLVFSIIGSLLLAAVVTSAPDEANYFNNIPVCGSFYDLSKTFANVLEFSEEFINSGKGKFENFRWSPKLTPNLLFFSSLEVC